MAVEPERGAAPVSAPVCDHVTGAVPRSAPAPTAVPDCDHVIDAEPDIAPVAAD
jgi:hypothetical protein